MKTSKYHTRKGYEQLLLRLMKEQGLCPYGQMSSLSDFNLLRNINVRLMEMKCVTLTDEELEMELH